ncbi:Glycosyl transferase family 39/83 [Trinorchestia longiramus]|nr:Glycosyl transferase family 39/83 [Trinorchestia longiramus]
MNSPAVLKVNFTNSPYTASFSLSSSITNSPSQLLLTLFATIGGYNASHLFTEAGLSLLGHNGLIFTRVCCSMLGAALPPLAFTTAWSMTRRLPTSLLAGLLVVSETGTLMLTKFILLDAPLLFFMMTTFSCLCRLHSASTLNEAYNCDRLAPLSTFFMDVSSPIFKFSTPFLHTTLTHKVVTAHLPHSAIDYSGTMSFCLQKMNYTSSFTFGGSLDRSSHVQLLVPQKGRLQYTTVGLALSHRPLLGLCRQREVCREDRQEFYVSHLSPGFQMNVEGAALRNISQAKEVTYGAFLTLRNSAIGGGFLTTFNSSYPRHVFTHAPKIAFSGRLKIPANYMQLQYVEDDLEEANHQYFGLPEVVMDGDLVRVMSALLGLYIGADPSLRAVMSPSHSLVYAEAAKNESPSKFVWQVQIDKEKHRAFIQWNFENQSVVDANYAENSRMQENLEVPWLMLDSRVRLLNVAAKCFLCFTGKKLPKSWGLDVHELSCSRDLKSCGSVWVAEQTTEKRVASYKNFNYLKYNLASRFLETHRLMFWTNSQFKPSDDEVERSVRPWMWPLCYKSQPWFSNGIRIVLLGNPVVFWLNIIGLCIAVAFISKTAFRKKRNTYILDADDSRVNHWSKWLLLAYLLHYLPFFGMARVLYYHHYFPALQFSSLLTGKFDSSYLPTNNNFEATAARENNSRRSDCRRKAEFTAKVRKMVNDPNMSMRAIAREMETKFPATMMVFGVVSSESDVIPPYVFPGGLRVNTDVYIDVLKSHCLPWITQVTVAMMVGRGISKLSSLISLLLMCLMSCVLLWSFCAFSFTAYGVYSEQPYDPHTSTTKHFRWLDTWELV